MESRSPAPSPGAPSWQHHPDMIDAAGNVRLIRTRPAEVWHVVARDGDGVIAACGVDLPADAERQTIAVESLLTAGRICLDCAQAMIGR